MNRRKFLKSSALAISGIFLPKSQIKELVEPESVNEYNVTLEDGINVSIDEYSLNEIVKILNDEFNRSVSNGLTIYN